MPDLAPVLAALNSPGTWLVLALNVALLLGGWRVGLNVLGLLGSRVHPRVQKLLRLAWSLAALYALLAVTAYLIRFQFEPLYASGAALEAWFRASAGRVVSVLVLAAIGWSLVDLASARIVPSNDFNRLTVRVQTLKGVVESTLRVAIIAVAGVTVLQNVGIEASTLLAGVSVFGLAVSFGAQSLVRDIITGFFILLEDQYGVGDVITVNAGPLSGVVERLNLRVTMLRALDGTLHVIPNGQINTVSVMSKDWSRVVATVGLPPTADADLALALLSRVSQGLYADSEYGPKFLEPPNIEGVTTLTRDGFDVRALFKVLPKEQWEVGREFNRRMKHALDEAGLGGLRPQLMVLRQEPGEGGGNTSPLSP